MSTNSIIMSCASAKASARPGESSGTQDLPRRDPEVFAEGRDGLIDIFDCVARVKQPLEHHGHGHGKPLGNWRRQLASARGWASQFLNSILQRRPMGHYL
jgi:hypothetical protein